MQLKSGLLMTSKKKKREEAAMAGEVKEEASVSKAGSAATKKVKLAFVGSDRSTREETLDAYTLQVLKQAKEQGQTVYHAQDDADTVSELIS